MLASNLKEEEEEENNQNIVLRRIPKSLKLLLQRLIQNRYSMLWYGIEIAVLQNAIEKYIYVVAYTTLKRYHDRYISRVDGRQNSTSNNPHASSTTTKAQQQVLLLPTMMIHILYGYIAQWVHLPITIPLETWKTQVQIYNNRSHLPDHNNDATPARTTDPITLSSNTVDTRKRPTYPKWEILHRMIYPPDHHHENTKKKFPIHLYSGVLSSYIILCWKPAIQYTIYESIQRIRKQRRRQEQRSNSSSKSWLESFVIAILARTIATILVYPYIRRRLLQLQLQQQTRHDNNQSVTATWTPATIKVANTECDDANENDTPVTPTQQPESLQHDGIFVQIRKCITMLLHRQPHILSLQRIRNVVRQHFDVTSYYGIGPELIRGALSSVITFLVQEYILRLVAVTMAPPNKRTP